MFTISCSSGAGRPWQQRSPTFSTARYSGRRLTRRKNEVSESAAMMYRASLVATLTLAAIATDLSHSAAQPPSVFAIDQILADPFPENLTAAKTGSAVAWTFNERCLRNIYMAEGPEFKPRRLTNYSEDDGRELADLSFSDDGRY